MARVNEDPQMGLEDEVVNDTETQEAIIEWQKAVKLASGASGRIKARDDDETQAEPVQYAVDTRPGPDDTKVEEQTRTFKPRLTVNMTEAPRE